MIEFARYVLVSDNLVAVVSAKLKHISVPIVATSFVKDSINLVEWRSCHLYCSLFIVLFCCLVIFC